MADPEESLEALSAALAGSVTEAREARARHHHARFAAEIEDQLQAAGLHNWLVECTQGLATVNVEVAYDDPATPISIVVRFPPEVVADPEQRRAVIPYLVHVLRPTPLETAELAQERALLSGDTAALLNWTRWVDVLRPPPRSWQEEAAEAFAAVERARRRDHL